MLSSFEFQNSKYDDTRLEQIRFCLLRLLMETSTKNSGRKSTLLNCSNISSTNGPGKKDVGNRSKAAPKQLRLERVDGEAQDSRNTSLSNASS